MKESALFEELQRIAECHQIAVSTANLKKYSYTIESGLCRVKGRYRVILDRHLHLSEKIDVLLEALRQLSVDTADMSPELQRLLMKKRAADPAPQSGTP